MYLKGRKGTRARECWAGLGHTPAAQNAVPCRVSDLVPRYPPGDPALIFKAWQLLMPQTEEDITKVPVLHALDSNRQD